MWIGTVDAGDETVHQSASAGIDDGYLDAITVTVDDSPTARGPAGTALRQGQVSAAQDIARDPAFEPWRDHALERGFQSVAAVPLAHDGTTYGVLVVYATRPDAFDGPERVLLAELGQAVGHAVETIHVRDRLEQQYRDLFETAPVMCALTRDAGGTPIVADCNRQFLVRLGYDREEVVGAPLATLYTAESAEALLDDGGYSRALDGAFTREERELLTADGDVVETVLRAVPRYDHDGETAGTLTLFVDREVRDAGESRVTGRGVSDAAAPTKQSQDEA